MIRSVLMALFCSVLLSACGADGEPVQPSLNANVGISGSGAYVNGGVGLSQGPLNIFVGF
ncbi:hypothetical protein K3727_05020 [Rhodobacteraceae bacterium M382]|nr:hypothetical protein K3727_05020 [Rhodobacteraceae bacterium M382]